MTPHAFWQEILMAEEAELEQRLQQLKTELRGLGSPVQPTPGGSSSGGSGSGVGAGGSSSSGGGVSGKRQ